MYKIFAIAPTSYQLKSLRATHLEIEDLPDGSFYGELFFNSKEECLDFMRERAYHYAFDENELISMLDEINNYNQLTIDAVTMQIELV